MGGRQTGTEYQGVSNEAKDISRYSDEMETTDVSIRPVAGELRGTLRDMNQVTSGLEELGVITDEQADVLHKTTATMLIAADIAMIVTSLKGLVDGLTAMETTLAGVETGVAVATQNYAGIALAAGTAGAIAAGFGGGYIAGKTTTQNYHINTDPGTPRGQREIYRRLLEARI